MPLLQSPGPLTPFSAGLSPPPPSGCTSLCAFLSCPPPPCSPHLTSPAPLTAALLPCALPTWPLSPLLPPCALSRLHCVLCLFYLCYVCWLLDFHYHQFLSIRQHYLKKGEGKVYVHVRVCVCASVHLWCVYVRVHLCIWCVCVCVCARARERTVCAGWRCVHQHCLKYGEGETQGGDC